MFNNPIAPGAPRKEVETRTIFQEDLDAVRMRLPIKKTHLGGLPLPDQAAFENRTPSIDNTPKIKKFTVNVTASKFSKEVCLIRITPDRKVKTNHKVPIALPHTPKKKK